MPSANEIQNQLSTIGKTITIKGEIHASDPVYIYGSVQGSISAPGHRVTVGTEGNVKADITAREVIVMGDVHGNVEGNYRVEIRTEGSLTGNLSASRVSIEEGAVLKGIIDIHKSGEAEKPAAQESSSPALQLVQPEATSAA